MPPKKTTQRKPPPAPKKKTPEEFQKAYQALCEKYGYQLNVIPVYKARDDGTFSTIIQVGISELRDNGQ